MHPRQSLGFLHSWHRSSYSDPLRLLVVPRQVVGSANINPVTCPSEGCEHQAEASFSAFGKQRLLPRTIVSIFPVDDPHLTRRDQQEKGVLCHEIVIAPAGKFAKSGKTVASSEFVSPIHFPIAAVIWVADSVGIHVPYPFRSVGPPSSSSGNVPMIWPPLIPLPIIS